jgi:hypothetical protein
MFLVSFQELELASLIGRPAWTVWLFDAQVGGLALHESLRLAVLPVACQLAALVPLAWSIWTSRSLPSMRDRDALAISVRSQTALWVLVLIAATTVLVIPAVLIGRGTFEGLARLGRNAAQVRMLLKEIFIGTGYALAASVASAFVAAWLLRAARAWRPALAGVVICALPGLFGSLILSLAMIQLLQQPFIYVLYKTPLALAAGLMLFLLPRAMVLRLFLLSGCRSSGLHMAGQLRESPSARVRNSARELDWQMQWRGEFWSVALLAYWGFLDLTIAYLLAPVTIVSAPVMLYNQMHFGKNAVLSALVLLTVLVPALVFVMASAARRFLFRWFWR